MRRSLAVVILALATAGAAQASVRVVEPFALVEAPAGAAVGLAVPGAGPEVTRESALNTLLTGEVESSLLGGARAREPRIDLDAPGGPDVDVVLPPTGTTENRRYPIALLGQGPGVLTSDSTRIDGLVSLADVANGDLRVVAVDDPVATLATLDRRIEWNDRWRLPLSVLLGGIAYLAAVAFPRAAPRVFLVGLALNLWLAGWWVVAVVGLAAAVLPLGLACASVIVAYLVALGLDPEAVALSPLGPSQAGRFYGLSNLLATGLLVPALVGAVAAGRRAGIAIGVAAIVTVGGNRFGADGGGLLVLLAIYAFLALRLARVHLTYRSIAALVIAVVAVGLVLVGIDAALGGSSHVTDAIADGPEALGRDIADRVELSVRRSVAGVGPAFACLASLVVLLFVATRRTRGPVTDALLVGLLVSILVNDTPGDVLGLGASVAFTVWRWESATPRAQPAHLVRLRAMRRSIAALALVVATLALIVAGCGGEDVTATPETVIGDVPTETSGGGEDLPALDLTGDAAAGEGLFASNGCGSCHTLSAAGTSGNVGPNLDQSKPSRELTVERVTLGRGGMPAFGDSLEAQQIADVTAYIVESTSG